MTVPIDLASLSLDDLVVLREMLRVKPGQRSLETRAGFEQAYALIRAYADQFYPAISQNKRAEFIARDLAHYESGAWLSAHKCRMPTPRCPPSTALVDIQGAPALAQGTAGHVDPISPLRFATSCRGFIANETCFDRVNDEEEHQWQATINSSVSASAASGRL